MTASSTEAFTPTARGIGCFNSGLLKTDQEKFWTSEVLAAASTCGFWEDDPELEVKKKVNELKRKFHSGRQLLIKHLPRDVTEEEIRELLSELPVQSVQLQSCVGSGVARASLDEPELLEEWDRDRVFLLRGQRVPVTPTPTEMLLCVARLPLHYTDAQFEALIAAYGEVRRCFLMISEKTGESKGYGFVEYNTEEAALHAKNVLDGKEVDNWVLCCDWLDSSHITFESLHSKCLYVDRLPKDFRDMGEFRKIFSSVVSPPYCQIALKNGCPQDWGLVEYSSSDDAETTQVSLNGYNLRGQNIRICYYIPGVRAINLYLKLLNDSVNRGKATGLLPDPPAPAVFQQLQNLAKQNPVFAQSLQNIIWTQIQSLQNGGGDNAKKTPAGASGNKGKPPSPAPDNAQAALVILLAAQMQAQMGNNQPSLLGNPQMLATLQNLIKRGPPTPQQPVVTTSGIPLVPPPLAHYPPPFAAGAAAPPPPQPKNGYLKPGPPPKVPLLPNPSGAMSPPPAEVAPHQVLEDMDQLNIWNGLLGQLQAQPQQQPPVGLIDPGGFYEMKTPLHTEKPQFIPAAKVPLKQNGNLMGFPEAIPGDLQQTISTILSNAQNLNQLLGSLSTAVQGGTAPTPIPVIPPPGSFPFVGVPSHLPQETNWAISVAPVPTSHPPPTMSMASVQNGRSLLSSPIPSVRPPMLSTPVTPGQPIMGSPVPVSAPKPPVGFLEVKRQGPYQSSWGPGTFLASPPTVQAAAPQFGSFSPPGFVPGLWSHPGSPVVLSPPAGLATPIGQKRKYNRLLPSPEPSPEGNYIGQHSQGLGGHYADSYFKRKKKN